VKIFPFDKVPAQEYAGMQGVTIRWVMGANVDAPTAYMRVIEVEPGHATGYHEHHWEHQAFVLKGQGAVRQGEERTPIYEGTCVYIKPNEIHQFINTGDSVLRFICVIPKPEDD